VRAAQPTVKRKKVSYALDLLVKLVMVLVFIHIAEIFLGILVEGFLAAHRTEVIDLPFILGCASGGGGVNVHMTDGVVYGC
jgi:hypothetical protein